MLNSVVMYLVLAHIYSFSSELPHSHDFAGQRPCGAFPVSRLPDSSSKFSYAPPLVIVANKIGYCSPSLCKYHRLGLVWWRSRRRLVDVVSSMVRIRRWLHFNVRLSSAKITLIFSVISTCRLVVVRRRLRSLRPLVVIWLLLRLVIWIVLCWSVAPRCPTSPTSPIVGLSSLTTSATRTQASRRV